jgi:hypothetical protein
MMICQRLSLLCLCVFLASCAAQSPRLADYAGPTASIEDTLVVGYTSVAGAVFFVEKIDGENVDNTLAATMRASAGQGSRLIRKDADRLVKAQKVKLDLVAKHFTTRPIDDILPRMRGEQLEFRAVLEFVPDAGKTYVVTGVLSKEGCGIWLEDFMTREIVGSKLSGSCKQIGLFK